jgi:cellobiose phosphorylase
MKKPKRHLPPSKRRSRRYGRFEPGNEVYRVTSTDTPRPWINLLTNGTYGALFSQHGLGFSFHVAPKTCEVTRWSDNESRPSHFDAGRHVFVKDLVSGRSWPGNPQPGDGKLYNGYRCRHGLGWSEISAEREGIEVRYRFFVPLSGNHEFWTVTVTNRSRRARRLALVPVVELPTRETYVPSRGRYDGKLRAVRCYQRGSRAWERLDSHLFFGLDRSVSAWDTSRDAFWGANDDRRRPSALETGLRKSSAYHEWLVAALETRISLRPGRSATFNAVLGQAERDAEAGRVLRRYRKRGAIEREFEALTEKWKERLSRARCTLPDKHAERYLSIWGKNAVTRTAESTGPKRIGYRDNLQYLRGYLLVDPEYVRERILWLLTFIFRSGRSLRDIDPVGDKHNLTDARDNPVWAAELVNAYVRETGDTPILDRKIAYFDGGKGPVWEHLVKIVARLIKLRGEHNLTLVGGGDWNDALGGFGKRGRGESAWLSLLIIRALRMLRELADATGRTRDARKLARWRDDLVDAFNGHAWDGSWYVYGWDDDGAPIGSRRSPEGKIYANAQSWALMEGIVPPNRVKRVWESTRKYLWTDAGILVCQPGYRRTAPTGSRIYLQGAGWSENASAYCHGTTFYMAACAALGKGEELLEALTAYLPSNPKNPNSGAEPFGVTNFYIGPDHPHFGRAPFSWFTGSSSWALFVGWEGLLGIVPDFDGLKIQPCVPRSWSRWGATRKFRGAAYQFIFRKKKGATGRRVRHLLVDGTEIPGNHVPALPRGTHRVVVNLA